MSPNRVDLTDRPTLDALRRRASNDPSAATKEAARQFEALFMQTLLKSMRDALPNSGLFGANESATYTAMLDQQFATMLAGRPGGLAERLAQQLDRQFNPSRPQGEAAPASRSLEKQAPVSPPQCDATVSPSAQRPLTERQQRFVDSIWQPALAAEKSTGIPAGFIVAQAALETGWGQRQIYAPDGTPSNNLFGIKAGAGWNGQAVSATTTEYADGVPMRRRENFRAYASYADSITDWAALMTRSNRYSAVVRGRLSAQEFAEGLQKAGYATDPHYAQKLTQIINQTLSLKKALNRPI